MSSRVENGEVSGIEVAKKWRFNQKGGPLLVLVESFDFFFLFDYINLRDVMAFCYERFCFDFCAIYLLYLDKKNFKKIRTYMM